MVPGYYYSLPFLDPDEIRLEVNHVPGKGMFADGASFDPAPNDPLARTARLVSAVASSAQRHTCPRLPQQTTRSPGTVTAPFSRGRSAQILRGGSSGAELCRLL